MSTTQIPSRIPLDDYSSVIGAGEVAELRTLAKPLTGRSVVMINSTAVGGGVAEILNRLVPLAEELGINIRWEVMTGGEDFFEVTKSFHNALHGAPYHPEPRHFEIFRAYNEKNAKRLPLDAEFMVIHDPQPAGLISYRGENANHWVWRCHIDLSHPHPAVWNFLENYVPHYDAAIFSSPEFAKQLPIPQYLFYPAIDPLAEKNRDLPPEFILDVLARYGIDHLRPILTQISRFDRLKDPVGVIRAYRIVRRYFDCQLVLAGGGASDDPEGATVLKEAQIAADGDPDIKLLELPAWAPLEVYRLARPFRRRHRVSNPLPAFPPRYRRAPRRTRPPARKGKFPDHAKPQTLSHPVSQPWEEILIPEPCDPKNTAATPNSFMETKKRTVTYPCHCPHSPAEHSVSQPKIVIRAERALNKPETVILSARLRRARRTSTSNVCSNFNSEVLQEYSQSSLHHNLSLLPQLPRLNPFFLRLILQILDVRQQLLLLCFLLFHLFIQRNHVVAPIRINAAARAAVIRLEVFHLANALVRRINLFSQLRNRRAIPLNLSTSRIRRGTSIVPWSFRLALRRMLRTHH